MRCLVIALLFTTLCFGVAVRGAGDCAEVSSTGGCSDSTCEAIVCSHSNYCCTHEYDRLCVGLAHKFCSLQQPVCPQPKPSPNWVCPVPGQDNYCFEASPEPGCSDESCCLSVCAVEPYCCEQGGQWDRRCVQLAHKECSGLCKRHYPCGASSSVDCVLHMTAPGVSWPTGEGFCSYGPCCQDVVARDPNCAHYYDRHCSDLAATLPACTVRHGMAAFTGRGQASTYDEDTVSHQAAHFAIAQAYPGLTASYVDVRSTEDVPDGPFLPHERSIVRFRIVSTNEASLDLLYQDMRDDVLRGLLGEQFVRALVAPVDVTICGCGDTEGWKQDALVRMMDSLGMQGSSWGRPCYSDAQSTQEYCVVGEVYPQTGPLSQAHTAIANLASLVHAFPQPFGLSSIRLDERTWEFDGCFTQCKHGIPFVSEAPTPSPTPSPTAAPTGAPTPSPTGAPTPSPTGSPTPSPTQAPTGAPTPFVPLIDDFDVSHFHPQDPSNTYPLAVYATASYPGVTADEPTHIVGGHRNTLADVQNPASASSLFGIATLNNDGLLGLSLPSSMSLDMTLTYDASAGSADAPDTSAGLGGLNWSGLEWVLTYSSDHPIPVHYTLYSAGGSSSRSFTLPTSGGAKATHRVLLPSTQSANGWATSGASAVDPSAITALSATLSLTGDQVDAALYHWEFDV